MSLKPYERCILGCKFTKDGKCTYAQNHINTIAVDFDRTLFRLDKWQGHEYVGEMIENADNAMNYFRLLGFKIAIHTTRNQKDVIQEALVTNNIPFDYINENPNQPPETSPGKMLADYYIDDRAIHFTDWKSVMKELDKRMSEDEVFKRNGIKI